MSILSILITFYPEPLLSPLHCRVNVNSSQGEKIKVYLISSFASLFNKTPAADIFSNQLNFLLCVSDFLFINNHDQILSHDSTLFGLRASI